MQQEFAQNVMSGLPAYRPMRNYQRTFQKLIYDTTEYLQMQPEYLRMWEAIKSYIVIQRLDLATNLQIQYDPYMQRYRNFENEINRGVYQINVDVTDLLGTNLMNEKELGTNMITVVAYKRAMNEMRLGMRFLEQSIPQMQTTLNNFKSDIDFVVHRYEQNEQFIYDANTKALAKQLIIDAAQEREQTNAIRRRDRTPDQNEPQTPTKIAKTEPNTPTSESKD